MNRARDVLKRTERAAWRASVSHCDPFAPVTAWDLGRLSNAASVAGDAIFDVLSTARINCHVRMTDAQLFGPDRPQPHPAPAPEAAPPADAPAPAEGLPRPRGFVHDAAAARGRVGGL